MNRMGLLIVVIIVAVALSGIAAASAAPAADKTNGKNLVAIDVIHWQKAFAKPDGVGNAKSTTCYAFLAKYGKTYSKWATLPVSYVINPSGTNLDQNFVRTAIQSAIETWDGATSKDLFVNSYTVDSSAQWGVQDFKNVLTWGDYPQDGVIAVTRYWIYLGTRSIAEFDILFDTDYTWGNADSNPSLMDVQNIATHELGHGIGLADVYNTPCAEVTMYGYSDNGDISKRTLEQPDIAGLQTLYGP